MQKSAVRSLRFTQIHLENWRNFSSMRIDLERRAFLVGPNASGKSNLLDGFRFLHDIVAIGGGFQEAVRRRGGTDTLRWMGASRNSDIVIEARVGDDRNLAAWEYELRFGQDNRKRPVIRRERVARNGDDLLKRPDEPDQKDPARLTQTYLEQVNMNQPFRDVADFLNGVSYRHVVPQLIRESDRLTGKADDPFGGDLLERIGRTPDRTRSVRLQRIRDTLQVAVPQLEEIELRRDDRGKPHLYSRHGHWRAGPAAWLKEEQFSDGTLRLVGLLWAILEGQGPLLLEEPELSLHPEVVRFIPQMFARAQRRSGRQILASTHSPDLLRDEGIGLDEVVVLQAQPEGTRAVLASDFAEVPALLEGGLSLAEAILPHTRPPMVEKFSLFGDRT